MANYTNLKNIINNVIRTNGQGDITGANLNQTLQQMVTDLGANYQYAGVATPSTNPGSPDQNVFYIATLAGTYSYFNSIVIPKGITVLRWDGSWYATTLYTVDTGLSQDSEALVQSGTVFEKFKIDGGPWDVSAHFPSAGPNNDGKFTLDYILANANTLIPTAWRKGGMSIRFVQRSDNKYIQYFCNSQTFTTNVADWEKMNLEDEVSSLVQEVGFIATGRYASGSRISGVMQPGDVVRYDISQVLPPNGAVSFRTADNSVVNQITNGSGTYELPRNFDHIDVVYGAMNVNITLNTPRELSERISQNKENIDAINIKLYGQYTPELMLNRFVITGNGDLSTANGWACVFKMPIISYDAAVSINPNNSLDFIIYSVLAYDIDGTFVGNVDAATGGYSFNIQTVLNVYPNAKFISLNIWKIGSSTALVDSDVADMDVKQTVKEAVIPRIKALEELVDEPSLEVDVELGALSTFSVRSKLSENYDIINSGGWNEEYSLERNPCFNYRGTTLVDRNSGTTKIINHESDNTNPANLQFGYIGANHGLASAKKITAPSHGKTYEDIGSKWVDGTGIHWYIVQIIDENNIMVVSEYYLVSGVYKFYSSITGNLTHVSGATHTETIPASTNVLAQWYPALKMVKKELLVDGKKVTSTGKYRGNVVDFVEVYDIFNPVSYLDKLISVVGTLTDNPLPTNYADVSMLMRFCNDYRFTKGGTNVLFVDEIVFDTINIEDLLALNSKSMTKNAFSASGNEEFYLPKSLPIEVNGVSYDYRIPQNFNNLAMAWTSAYWENPDNPPSRAIRFVTNGTKRMVGLHHGLVPLLGASIPRKDFVSLAWRIARDINTSYGMSVNAIGIQHAGAKFSWVSFRKYEDVQDNIAGLISNSQFEINEKYYIFLDFNGSGDFPIHIPDEWVGKTITIIEKSDNVDLLNTFGQGEILVSVASASPMYGYLVAKIN